MATPHTVLSFIVPAHNEAASIVATVQAIVAAAEASGSAYEVIVVDDASTDDTATLASAAGARVVAIAARQIAAARNAGAGAARGQTLVFVDADTLIGVDVVRGVLRVIAAGAVGGGAAIHFDEPLPRWVRLVLPLSIWLARRTRFTGGCFIFATQVAFAAAGGFDERLFAAEELALCRGLHRQGRFVILREAVLTSGRKLRSYSGWEILRSMFAIGLAGRGGLRDRRRLDIWYGPRRPDPREPH
ncbi:MAG: glycosyltransferase [Pseudomonadota bacterium]|nr:glycosyltransferase [Pseudomonadota bacterium]